ncbi:MAG: AAA family ATPase, partial [Chloroflexota bacterium]
IDEYDNFANQLIVSAHDTLYEKLTGNDGFLKSFFKMLKAGREGGFIENVYITGILPMTMDDLASAFNVGTYLSQDPTFEAMVGFTQAEVDWLLDEIWKDHTITANTRDEIGALLKANYNGYHFVRPGSDPRNIPIYNTTILMYFLRYYTEHQEVPPSLMDSNLETDIGWPKRLVEVNAKDAKPFIDDLTTKEIAGYSERSLAQQFNVSQFFEKRFFPVSFFYLGLLTRKDDLYLTFPNLNMHQIFLEYFNELYDIDVSNPYKEPLEAFLRQPDFEAFFACYWESYIEKLPETIFAQVNENFYRTTFYEVCTQHFPPWFLLNVETSYPKGKSDLEFIGKNERQFAGMHWIIEFKYYSKTKMREKDVKIQTFEAVADDIVQVQGYGEGLRQKSPDADLSMFLVYCFANEGFRVFPVDEV